MSRRDDEELMAFLDGELAPRDARAVEGRIDASPDARAKVAALTELSTIVRGHYEQATAEVEPNMAAAWARLEAQLGDAPEKSPAARADSTRLVPQTGFWQGLLDGLTPRWSHVMTGAIGAAAGALLVAAVSRQQLPSVTVNVTPPAVQPDGPSDVVAAIAEDTQVDDLDVQSGTAMVFQVPGQNADKPATTVIWVTDDSPTEGPI